MLETEHSKQKTAMQSIQQCVKNQGLGCSNGVIARVENATYLRQQTPIPKSISPKP